MTELFDPWALVQLQKALDRMRAGLTDSFVSDSCAQCGVYVRDAVTVMVRAIPGCSDECVRLTPFQIDRHTDLHVLLHQ